MRKDTNIIDEVLNEQSFSKKEIDKFKDMLNIVTENKKFGFHKDLKIELKSIIERDELNENK
jgi:hypothetical protein